ncbi:MAG: hypothetical protein LBH87_01630, partial [Coriobacteriales bacterium]|nr:hypothetical protein [Coriobacteriales bacterium]
DLGGQCRCHQFICRYATWHDLPSPLCMASLVYPLASILHTNYATFRQVPAAAYHFSAQNLTYQAFYGIFIKILAKHKDQKS